MHRWQALNSSKQINGRFKASQLASDCCAGLVLQSYVFGASGDATVEIGTSAVATAHALTVTVDDAVEIGASATATAHALGVVVDVSVEIGASATATAHDVTVTTTADATVEVGANAVATAHDLTVVVDATVEIGASATATAHDVDVVIVEPEGAALECAHAIATAWPLTVTIQDRPAADDSSLRYAVVRPTYRELATDRRVASSIAVAGDRAGKPRAVVTDSNVLRRNVAMSARAHGSRVGTVSRMSRTL